MGTISIEQWANIGGSNSPSKAQIYDTLVGKTDDATTSTTAESVTTSGSAGYISVYAVEAHRVSIGGNGTADAGKYVTIAAGERRDIGLYKGGDVVYYRSEA